MLRPLRRLFLVAVMTVSPLSSAIDHIVFLRIAPSEARLFISNADGSGERTLTQPGTLDYNPDWSPSGHWIVFTSERAGSADLYRIHPDGTGLERLTDDPAYDDQGALSPDDKQVVFVSTRAAGRANLWVLDLITHKARPLTSGDGGHFRPAWSPDGEWIAFSSDRESSLPPAKGRWERLHLAGIYLIRPDGTGLSRISTHGNFCGGPKWTRDSKSVIAYCIRAEETWTYRGSDQDSETQLVQINAQTGATKALAAGPGVKMTPSMLASGEIAYLRNDKSAHGVFYGSGKQDPTGSDLYGPSWSPGGTRLVYSRYKDRYAAEPIKVWSRNPTYELSTTAFLPAYDPTGERFTVTDADYAAKTMKLLIVDDGKPARSILERQELILGPQWSPDGRSIIFGIGAFPLFTVFDSEGQKPVAPAQVGMVNADGSGFQVITSGPNRNAFPSFAPDGKQIVYRTTGSDGTGLRIMKLEDHSIIVLTTDYDNFPVWSPRGDLIAFVRKIGDDFEVFTIRPDGKDVNQLTHTKGNDAHLGWSPDGERIVFTSSRMGFKDEALNADTAAQPYGEIFVMRYDGTQVEQLTDNQWEDGGPSWQPHKQQATKQGTQDAEAYELYLKGRSYLDKQNLSDLKTAVSYFNQAIAKDPGYALAYSGLARVYAILPDFGDSPVEDHPKAMALARKALELDPTLSEPHAVLGGQMMALDWDFTGGVAEFKKAVALDPNNAQVHFRYAVNISIVGGMEPAALAEINRAHELEPHRRDISVWVGNVYNYARRFDEAIVACKKVANDNPSFADAADCLAAAYWGKKMYPQVIEQYKVYDQLSHDDFAAALVQGFASGGWPGALRKCAETLTAKRKSQPSSTYGTAYQIAQCYADLGDKDQTFQWLNTALQEHDENLTGLQTDFVFDPIRSDPRFAELVRKVGLPQTQLADEALWPTQGWATASPVSVGLDEPVLLGLDQDIASGEYSQIIDSLAIFRCGKKVFGRTYPREYAKMYHKEAGKRGPYNMRLNGRYNYFDPYWHPYYHGTDLHTMQSITKTITGVILGAAVQRGDFKASLDTPVLKYFDSTKVKNVDDRKRRMTLRDLLNMTTGFAWDAEGFEISGDPKNDTSQMEGSDDWVQYAIDKPMVAEPGKVFNYNDGAAVLLAHIFQKETGWDIDDYAQKYLFAPLGMRHEWKRTYRGVVDTEGGLYLTVSDLAKVGYLYLNDGVWEGQRIVSSEWVKQSLSQSIPDDEPDIVGGKVVGTIHFRYGFLWTFLKLPDSTEYVWLGLGFGGQHLELFPQEGLIVTFTGWDFDPSSTNPSPSDFLAAVKTKTCPGDAR